MEGQTVVMDEELDVPPTICCEVDFVQRELCSSDGTLEVLGFEPWLCSGALFSSLNKFEAKPKGCLDPTNNVNPSIIIKAGERFPLKPNQKGT